MLYLFANYVYNRNQTDMYQTETILFWKQEIVNEPNQLSANHQHTKKI